MSGSSRIVSADLFDAMYNCEVKRRAEGSASPSPVTPEMWQQLQFENALRQVFGIEFTPVMIERRGRMPPALRARSKLMSSYIQLEETHAFGFALYVLCAVHLRSEHTRSIAGFRLIKRHPFLLTPYGPCSTIEDDGRLALQFFKTWCVSNNTKFERRN